MVPSDENLTPLTWALFLCCELCQSTVVFASFGDRAKHECKMQSPVALQGAQKFLSCFCADEMDAPIRGPSRDDVGGPILQASNCRVKARRAPSARSVVVPQDPRCRSCRGTAGANPSEEKRTCCRAARRLHGTQRSGTHTVSCGGARSLRLHSAARSRHADRAWRAYSC
jgi:hypothetical protein